MNLHKNISLSIITYLLFYASVIYADEVCTEYFNTDNPTKTLHNLISDPQPKAQFCAGGMYFKGEGVLKNVDEAFKWVKKAAEESYPPAQTTLGIFYLKGEGTDVNESLAYQWILKAAKQGHPKGLCALGTLYYEGRGIGQDYIEAIKWLIKAKETGCKYADSVLHNTMLDVHWRKSNGQFTAQLILYDQKRTYYPNESNLHGSEYLTVKENEQVFAKLYFIGCQTDTESLCTETADIAVYMPDWTLALETKKMHLLKSHPAEPSSEFQDSDVNMLLKMETGDLKGIYHILVTIYDAEHNQKITLNQQYLLK